MSEYPKKLRINVQDASADLDENSLHSFFMLYIPTALRRIFLIYRVLYRIYSSRGVPQFEVVKFAMKPTQSVYNERLRFTSDCCYE